MILNRKWICAGKLKLATVLLSAGCAALSTGCASLLQSPVTAEKPATETSWTESARDNTTKVVNFVSGREQEDPTRGKEYYQRGDTLFRQASTQPEDQRVESFRAAADLFERAGEASPGTALQQDSLYMQGESLFFADRLTEAAEVYQTLQKEFPRSRHNDRVASRLFAISRYWIDVAKSNEGSWIPINLTDPKYPRIDTDGHAIRVLDQIRYDDPTGKLADDATMAAAAEYIRQKDFESADEFLSDLRESYSDSDHLFLAHLLGIQCKLEIYAGPKYSGLILEEAEELVKKTRQRFPDKMQEAKYRDMVARAAAQIQFLRAERLAYRAEYREKRKEYGAARYYYNELLKAHGDTPQAELARNRLTEIAELPAVPTQHLSWLTTVFPDSSRSDPLVTKDGNSEPSDAPTDSPTMMR